MNINFSLTLNFLIYSVTGNIMGVIFCHSAYKYLFVTKKYVRNIQITIKMKKEIYNRIATL